MKRKRILNFAANIFENLPFATFALFVVLTFFTIKVDRKFPLERYKVEPRMITNEHESAKPFL